MNAQTQAYVTWRRKTVIRGETLHTDAAFAAGVDWQREQDASLRAIAEAAQQPPSDELSRLREVLQDEIATLLGDIAILTARMPPEVTAKYRNCERVERIRSALGITGALDAASPAAQTAGDLEALRCPTHGMKLCVECAPVLVIQFGGQPDEQRPES